MSVTRVTDDTGGPRVYDKFGGRAWLDFGNTRERRRAFEDWNRSEIERCNALADPILKERVGRLRLRTIRRHHRMTSLWQYLRMTSMMPCPVCNQRMISKHSGRCRRCSRKYPIVLTEIARHGGVGHPAVHAYIKAHGYEAALRFYLGVERVEDFQPLTTAPEVVS